MSGENPSKAASSSGRRVLVTGIEGFTGIHLRRHLERGGYEVHGIQLAPGDGKTVYQADLLDLTSLARVIADVRPHHVIHLAGVSLVTHDDVAQIYNVNVTGTRNLLAALAAMPGGAPRSVLLASSGNIYGNCDCDPLSEDLSPRPANDYAVSKAAMEMVAGIWAGRMPIAVVRPFNYTGRGQSENFLVPKIVSAFRRRLPEIELGNIDVERDFSDVRDVVSAYGRLMAAEWSGLTNICSGRAISLSRILALCGEITDHGMAIRVNPAFVRGNEVHRLRGSRARMDALGILEFRAFRETLAWMLGKEL
jgi:nucleoside-diphosphate-sugar epimerase